MIGDTEERPMCAICRDDTECDFVTRCGHHYHESCLSKIVNPQTCPYCQQPISNLKWKEKILWNVKSSKMEVSVANEILDILGSISGINMQNGSSQANSKIPPFGKYILEELTKIGWEINSPVQVGSEFLLWACERDDLYRLNLLFEYGLKLDDNAELKTKALDLAIKKDSNLVASRIKDHSFNFCDDDENGNSPLHVGVGKNDLELVKALILKGADVNTRNIFGVRPLHLAASECNLEILTLLIENGSKIDCHDLHGRNPLHEACRSQKNSIEVITKLLDAGAKTEYLDNDKNTLLHNVLISKKFDIAEVLINRFSDINQLNAYKETCMHLAASFGPKSLISKMIRLGAEVNMKDFKGQTPLHKAVMTNSVEVAEFLLQKGADVDALNNKK